MIPAGWEGREPNPHSGMWRASIRRVFHVKHLVAC